MANETLPLPSLGNSHSPLTQPWSAVRDDGVLTTLRAQMSRGDFLRCSAIAYVRRLATYASIVLAGVSIIALVVLLQLYRDSYAVGVVSVVAVILGGVAAVISLFFALMEVFMAASVALRTLFLPEAPLAWQAVVTRDGIACNGVVGAPIGGVSPNGLSVCLLWRRAGAPVYWHGNTYISEPQRIGGCGVYLPRAAFASEEAARGFHIALTALWRARGKVDALSPELFAVLIGEGDSTP